MTEAAGLGSAPRLSREGQPRGALALKAGWHEQLAGQEPSLIARNIFLGGARRIRRELETPAP